jgi:hemerythrin
MSLMEWNSNLDIGVDAMNDEHKVLLKYMNQLFDLYHAKADYGRQKTVLDQLKDATIKHFTQEEAYMEKIGFEGIASHKIIHKQLLEKFTVHYQEFEQKQQFNEGFFTFLKMWLSAHIQGIDIKYGEFSRSKKKSA